MILRYCLSSRGRETEGYAVPCVSHCLHHPFTNITQTIKIHRSSAEYSNLTSLTVSRILSTSYTLNPIKPAGWETYPPNPQRPRLLHPISIIKITPLLPPPPNPPNPPKNRYSHLTIFRSESLSVITADSGESTQLRIVGSKVRTRLVPRKAAVETRDKGR